MKRLRTSNLFHRILSASSFAIGLAASVAPLGSVDAATVTLSGGTSGSCTYSAASVDANGNTTYTCSGGITPPTGPGTLSFTTGGPVSVLPSGTTTVAVNRTGGSTGAVTGTIAVTSGACSLSTNTVSFGDASSTPSPASIVVTAPASAPASCTLTLGAGTGSPLVGSPSAFNLSVTDANGNVTFAFSAGTSSSTFGSGSPTDIVVTRSGGNNGAWNVPYAVSSSSASMVTGGALAAGAGTITGPSPLYFPPNSQSAIISYSPPATPPAGVTAPADITFTLGQPVIGGPAIGGQSGSLGASTNLLTIAAGSPTVPGCTTTADHILAYPNHNFYVDGTKKNESTAVAMTVGPGTLIGGLGKFTVVESSSTGYNTDIQYTVSACPGDFNLTAGSYCGITKIATGGALTFAVGELPPGVAWWAPVCVLPAGTSTVYFNFRQVVKGPGTSPAVPLTPSCTIGTTCPVWLQYN